MPVSPDNPSPPTRGDPPGVRARAMSAPSGDTRPAFFEPSPISRSNTAETVDALEIVEITGDNTADNPPGPVIFKKFKVSDTGHAFIDSASQNRYKDVGLFNDLVNSIRTAVPGDDWRVADDTLSDFEMTCVFRQYDVHISMSPDVGDSPAILGIVEFTGESPLDDPSILPNMKRIFDTLNAFFSTRLGSNNTVRRQLDFEDENIREMSVFVNPEVAPQMVDGFYEYTMTLKPEIAEELSNDLDATLAAINRMLVARFAMSSEGVFLQEGEVEGENDEYIMNFKSESEPAKMVGIRIPSGGGVSNMFIRISTAFTEEEAGATILYDIENVISDMSSPLQDNNDPMMLSGRRDENLTFYERLAPIFSLEGPSAKPLPINNTVYDQEASDYVMLQDFVLPGNKLVFLLNGKQIGISYAPFIKNIREGNSIFYECSRVFTFNPAEGQFGTFEPYEIYAQPYIELALTSRVYITREDFNKLLSVPVHPYWEIKDAGRTLNATASRSSVVQGGPVQSMLHCQDGSDLKVYTIEPYMPQIDKDEEEDACEVPQIVTLQRDEVRTQVDISENNTVIGAKEWYARENTLEVAKLRFIFRGQVMSDDGVLTPGTVVLVTIIPDRPPEEQKQDQPPEGARRTRRRRRRNTNKNTRHR